MEGLACHTILVDFVDLVDYIRSMPVKLEKHETETSEQDSPVIQARNIIQISGSLEQRQLPTKAKKLVIQIHEQAKQLEAQLDEFRTLLSSSFSPENAGLEMVEKMKGDEGGAWTGKELQEKFKLGSAILHRRRKEWRIVCWRDAKGDFHYPKWQFNEAGALLHGIQEILKIFQSNDEWRVMRYFLGKRKQLDDGRPLDLLREDASDRVITHARIHAEENTW